MRALVILLLLAGPVQAQTAEETALRQADANGDGGLSPNEFRTFMQSMAALGHRSARLVTTFGVYGIAFRQVDTDGDGWASPAELITARD